MKKYFLITLLFLFTIATIAFARGGIFSTILQNAETIKIEGKVISVPVPFIGKRGQAMTLDTENGEIKVYGLGPIWYWQKNQVERPTVGETVNVEVYKLDINGELYYILKNITLSDGKKLNLRDSDTTLPLWRGAHGRMNKGGYMGRKFDNSTCPFAK